MDQSDEGRGYIPTGGWTNQTRGEAHGREYSLPSSQWGGGFAGQIQYLPINSRKTCLLFIYPLRTHRLGLAHELDVDDDANERCPDGPACRSEDKHRA
eukprot:535737-Prorocentrum_minimum.AAC.1